MKLMHTKLPEFIQKVKDAAAEQGLEGRIAIRGLENVTHAKLQSLRTGRIEAAVREIAGDKKTERVEVVVMPRVPETMHTVVIKGVDKSGRSTRAILEVINILAPTEDVELADCAVVEDRRPPLGKH